MERLIRDEGTIDPQDTNLGRFVWRTTQSLLRERVMGKELDAAEELLRKKDIEGNSLLGPLTVPLKNWMRYMRGVPDGSQIVMNNVAKGVFSQLNTRITQMNKLLPKGYQIEQVDWSPSGSWNKFILAQYVANLGGRAAVLVRDSLQSLTNNLPNLGPKAFFGGIKDMFDPALRDIPERYGALLRSMNVGQLYGDIIAETTPSNFTRFAQKVLSPIRGAHNIDRRSAFLGFRQKMLPALSDYVTGKITSHDFMSKSGLWFFDDAVGATYLKQATVPYLSEEVSGLQDRLQKLRGQVEDATRPGEQARLSKSVDLLEGWLKTTQAEATRDLPRKLEDLTNRASLDYIWLTQWPYIRGTQSGFMRTGIGRVLGQYSVWPTNQLEFLRRMAHKATVGPYRKEALQAVGLWSATNFAVVSAFAALGADVSRWFWFSSAGLEGGPSLQAVEALGKAFKDDEEGRKARRTLFEFPLQVVPGSTQVRHIVKMLSQDKLDIMTLMGFKPYEELTKDQDIMDILEEEFGYKEPPRRRKPQ